MFGFYRVSAAVPKLEVANIAYNSENIIELIKEGNKKNVSVISFPELCLTGYTCGDLFFQKQLISSAELAIANIAKKTANCKIVSIIGVPLQNDNRLYNCAVVIHQGHILGVVPKSFLPNYKEFYDARWFASGIKTSNEISINNQKYPFGTDILFELSKDFKFAIEICEDLWNIIPPSSNHAIAGANVIFNLSASNELVGKNEYRKQLILSQSAKCLAGYVYASAGIYESTTDNVYSGYAAIAENGIILSENKRFQRENNLITTDIDCEKLSALRMSETNFKHNPILDYHKVEINNYNTIKNVERVIPPYPFVPYNDDKCHSRCEEIFHIQVAGLAKRIEHIGSKTVIIGISGGLDSTLALLVVLETFKTLNKDTKNIITITMPGFGTTDRTYSNAVELCKLMKTNFSEIDIKASCLQHFKDINHDPNIYDVTYENVQARERTKILMNIANKEKGIVIGTGDLSEIALGWSTYNGDQMSMYAVNCGVPKTLIRHLIKWISITSEKNLSNILNDIIATPVSPELLPNNKNIINQKTEKILGPYDLHDFFLYHIIKYGAKPEKVVYIAKKAFEDKYETDFIKNTLKTFIKRFFSQQFKRSCIPDGPKVGTIALSPRGDWRMPSDASYNEWLNF